MVCLDNEFTYAWEEVVLGVSHEAHFLEIMLVSLEGGEVISRIKFIAPQD